MQVFAGVSSIGRDYFGDGCLQRPGWRRIAVGLLAAAAFGFTQTSASAARLRIGGTGSGLPILKKLLRIHRPDLAAAAATTMNTGGLGALNALRDGVVDMAVSGREPSGEFVSPRFKTILFMRSPFIFVTSPENPAVSVSRSEIASFYAGTGKWPDGTLARVVLRPPLDIDTQLVRNISPAMEAAVDSASKRAGLYTAATDTLALAAVARVRGAFSPSTLTFVNLTDFNVKILAYEGVMPSARALAQGTYPLQKTLWLTIRQPAPPEVEEFVAFLSSAPARRIVCDSGAMTLQPPCQ